MSFKNRKKEYNDFRDQAVWDSCRTAISSSKLTSSPLSKPQFKRAISSYTCNEKSQGPFEFACFGSVPIPESITVAKKMGESLWAWNEKWDQLYPSLGVMDFQQLQKKRLYSQEVEAERVLRRPKPTKYICIYTWLTIVLKKGLRTKECQIYLICKHLCTLGEQILHSVDKNGN